MFLVTVVVAVVVDGFCRKILVPPPPTQKWLVSALERSIKFGNTGGTVSGNTSDIPHGIIHTRHFLCNTISIPSGNT